MIIADSWPTAGTWPNWIQAGFTSLAFVVAALTYRRSVQVRREAQARLVYSALSKVRCYDKGAQLDLQPKGVDMGRPIGGLRIEMASGYAGQWMVATEPVLEVIAIVHNGSKELIGPAKLQVVRYLAPGKYERYEDFAALVGVVNPESEYVVRFVFPNPGHPGQPSLSTTLLFRDASGQWWRRFRAEPIEAVHDDPENAQEPRGPAQQPEGPPTAGTATATPELSLRVRWERLMRRARDKPPIP